MRKINLRKALFILPNLFTLASVFCGFLAVLACTPDATSEDFYTASLLILFAMFFDTIDGRVARLTKTQSAIGVQLDSLADVLSFGLAPAVLVYRWSLSEVGFIGLILPFAYISCGAIRLARFNVVTTGEGGAPKTPSKYILGLPIPAAAGILVSLVVASHVEGTMPGTPVLIATVVLLLSFLMVSTVKFRSFKDLRLNARTGAFIAFAVGSTVAVGLRFGRSYALVWFLGAYVGIGIIETFIVGARRIARRGEPSEADA